MRMYDLIAKKRDGSELSKEEINRWIQAYIKGDVPDYQVSALLMAIYFQGLNETETIALTHAMIHSGETIDLSGIAGVKVDKHSTGGVGDKTTIVLAPLVAAAGVPVAKLSGRGLGHTGGTLDKFESFSGFKVEMTAEQFIEQVNYHGIAVAGQTASLVPADKKLYALRDVTATVDNISLIATSIMSKKLASGADAIVLDVKTGSGSYTRSIDSAFELAELMVKIGEGVGKKTIAVISEMDQPLGNAVGNINEVKEAIETLNGGGPADLRELCLSLGANMMLLAGATSSYHEGKDRLREVLDAGKALEKLKELVEMQGGNPEQVARPVLLPSPLHSVVLECPEDGYIAKLESRTVGLSAMLAGAGRTTKESPIDYTSGIYLHHKVGKLLSKGDILATIYGNNEAKLQKAKEVLNRAYHFSKKPPPKRPLIFGYVNKDKSERLY